MSSMCWSGHRRRAILGSATEVRTAGGGRKYGITSQRTCDLSKVALIYVRKSVVRYEEDRASPERQLANCARVCEEKGWQYEVYEDAEGHRSGRSEKHRPG